MRIALSTTSLEGLGGSETYAVTVADQLQRLGHDVWLHAVTHGHSSATAEQLGLRVIRDDASLPEELDVLIVQDAAVAYEMAARYPATAQLFVAHSDRFDLQLPPQLPDIVAAVVTLYDRVERRIGALALSAPEIVRLTQPIDVDRYVPTRPVRPRPEVALALSNYIAGPRLRLLRTACDELGIELRHAGSHAASGSQPSAAAISDADIVFGKARVIYEAMACGRAAYVYDWNGGDGWVTAANFAELSRDNFGGQSGTGVIDRERLIADLARYDPSMGAVNRDLVIAHNAATKHAAALIAVIQRLVPRAVPVDAPLQELARLVRVYHRADAQAASAQIEVQRFAARVQELEAELSHARVAQTAVEDARDRAAAAAADAQMAWARLRELTATRRWRVLQMTLCPLDRLRRWVRRRRHTSLR